MAAQTLSADSMKAEAAGAQAERDEARREPLQPAGQRLKSTTILPCARPFQLRSMA